ncbi:MAG: GxxExxY protein, partial [Candidatus Peribacteraceae bacterium]|nr:GxxExxY protein [Candidatus Peribacteraceae bacterium]
VIYQRALAEEMRAANIDFIRELPISILYKGKDIGERRADFIVGGKVMVELKALTKIENVHFAQAINYLEAYNIEIGLLINFGAKSLEFRRFAN